MFLATLKPIVSHSEIKIIHMLCMLNLQKGTRDRHNQETPVINKTGFSKIVEYKPARDCNNNDITQCYQEYIFECSKDKQTSVKKKKVVENQNFFR